MRGEVMVREHVRYVAKILFYGGIGFGFGTSIGLATQGLNYGGIFIAGLAVGLLLAAGALVWSVRALREIQR